MRTLILSVLRGEKQVLYRGARLFISIAKTQMLFSKKLVLHCPNGIPEGMAELAAQFVADGVMFVASVGPACREIEDMVDDAAIAAGSPEKNFILTSSHPDESVADAIEFAEGLTGEYGGPVQLVELVR